MYVKFSVCRCVNPVCVNIYVHLYRAWCMYIYVRVCVRATGLPLLTVLYVLYVCWMMSRLMCECLNVHVTLAM